MRHIAQFNEENKWKIQEGDICPKCGEEVEELISDTEDEIVYLSCPCEYLYRTIGYLDDTDD